MEQQQSEEASKASFWAMSGTTEHASVAEFSRLSLVLLGLGAPADLIADVHRAALDEIAHAKTCFSIASHYAKRPMVPGPLDVTRGSPDMSLDGLVFDTVRDGCLGETRAATELAVMASAEADPELSKKIAAMGCDEERHAELAWRIVYFALEIDPQVTRGAIVRFLSTMESRSEDDRVVRSALEDMLSADDSPHPA